jgi:hypothetical protein
MESRRIKIDSRITLARFQSHPSHREAKPHNEAHQPYKLLSMKERSPCLNIKKSSI